MCGEASLPVGGDLGLNGHGLRDRQVRGPHDPDWRPTWVVVGCRRYACNACDAILTVVPRGIAPRRHYGYAAIALALTLWQLVKEPVAEVRRRVCAWPISFEAPSRWPVLQRTALGDASLSLDVAAARWAQIAVGRAPPSARSRELWVQAFIGGSVMP